MLQVKNDIGWKGAEPSIQLVLYFWLFCDQHSLQNDESTCYPSLVIFIVGGWVGALFLLFCTNGEVGPHLGFGGCALTSRPMMEIFYITATQFSLHKQ